MIGILIPVHNEEQLLGACLTTVLQAAAHPDLNGEAVEVLVVLDSCTDSSAEIARAHGVMILEVTARNVGQARAEGAAFLLDRGARWLACTDGDSSVASDWLSEQLALDADAVCGTVMPGDWNKDISAAAQAAYLSHYQHRDGHRHIHGANLGVSSIAYVSAGGFPALACHEDVHLVQQLELIGARIAWSCRPRVTTSTRLDSKARGGFGDYLRSLTA
ncbi:glycosyltransferase [Pseudomonas cannabina]|uniref:Glycosyl transferase, group 2 protein n=3 Tax=Pseudomonas syringae group TaxID=136849 RepID=A0A3M3QT88_PSECA|nr:MULTISPECIES: glycosyltransferase [Pseudomonas syringae group]KPB71558.1 Glycosyl transferase [Pseudomonas syringae pv. maculicola]KPW20324.1 Glycosyl transferase, group 2 family protein [Pseudomonas cannabina pv. alisalensis]MBM0138055.1 glycosyltransferase family 2 protein [Pseudomonas cannabina pv. alisalensis]QHE97477.1 glycosyltransferase [Pseudomonas syringae pv. maculicola str. ES4326]QQN24270.1 glycosyltransferase family 2 protein [Pseudomonas cannabina pv. alisalensis]